MIGNLFSKLFAFLIAMLKSIGGFLKDTAQTIIDLLFQLYVWLGQLLQRLLQSLIDVLVAFFMVIYDVIRGLLYLIYMIGVLAVKLFQVIFAIAKLLWSFIVGLGKTIASLFYVSGDSAGHGYSEMMGQVAAGLSYLQLDVVAYILLFGIWIFTAFSVIHVLSSMGGGGE